MTATVVVGVPTFNGSATVEEALQSLLDQAGPELLLVVRDDASTDGTPDVVARLAERDDRVRLVVNQDRLGMVANWNAVLADARRLAPDARYFAWGSDHDIWRPDWLHDLAAALDDDPAAVLAYPLVERQHEDGRLAGGWQFDTRGVGRPRDRLGRTVRDGVAGDMIYGLARLDALGAVGGYQPVVYPDRLLLARLALRGEFVQVPRVLWNRRMGRLSTAERQRSTLFAGRPPAYARLPWWAQHVLVLREDPRARAAYAKAAGGVALRPLRATVGRLLRRLGVMRPPQSPR